MQSATLYEQLGGQAIKQVVNDFYTRVLADDTVNSFFAHTDMEKQRRHQTAFISFALGSSTPYTGRSMEKAHAGLNLQPEHFDAIVKHLSEALAAHHVLSAEIDRILNHIATLKTSVLYK